MEEKGAAESDAGPALRADMVEAARKFMLTPKVRETPFEEQRQFLLNKGVTDAEIEKARSSIPAQERGPVAPNGQPQHYYPPSPPPQNKILSFAQSALIIGSVSYSGYRFLRSYILPKFFDIPDPATEEVRQLQAQVNDLQNSIKFVIDSVSQTTQTLATQQQEIARALLSVSSRDTDIARVEAGISTIKGLLLSQTNFTPIVKPVATIPSWQQAGISSGGASAYSGYTTPPANFKAEEDGVEEADEEVIVQ